MQQAARYVIIRRISVRNHAIQGLKQPTTKEGSKHKKTSYSPSLERIANVRELHVDNIAELSLSKVGNSNCSLSTVNLRV